MSRETKAFEDWLVHVTTQADRPRDQRQVLAVQERLHARAIVGELLGGQLDMTRSLAEALYAAHGGHAAKAGDPHPVQPEASGTDFRRKLHSQQVSMGVLPVSPPSDQTHTLMSDEAVEHATESTIGGIKAAKAALEWSCERYAQFQAELAVATDPAAIFAREGLTSRYAKEAVIDGWQRRLEANSSLKAQYDAALEAASSRQR